MSEIVTANERAKVCETAKQAFHALLSQWETNGNKFVDKDKMREEGIMSAAIGSVSLLLLTVGFADEAAGFYTAEELEKVSGIISECLLRVENWVKEDGYSAAPNVMRTEEIFKGRIGYTDSVTWVHSMCVLSRFAERKKILSFSAEIHDKILFYLGQSLSMLIDSQREEGTWGFRTEPAATGSLYYSYSVAATLGDFFDYIADELSDVEKRPVQRDEEVYGYLKKTFGDDFPEKVVSARVRLAKWILRYPLAYLPQIANCKALPSETQKLLGIWNSVSRDTGTDNYFNLYYVYFLIDMIVLTNADGLYADLCAKGGAEFEELKAALKENMIKDGGKDYASEDAYKYYFEQGEHAASFVTDYIEQATHASRFCLNSAVRTGSRFWTSANSELPLLWEHPDPAVCALIDYTNGLKSLTDPSLTPMALRANTQYTYYISKRPDVTLENLFNFILQECCETDARYCVKDLWDTMRYSLSVTERSLEALLDYYDYVRQYETSAPATARSELDLAIEKKIDAYLSEKYFSAAPAVPAAPAEPAPEAPRPKDAAPSDLLSVLKTLNKKANSVKLPNPSNPEHEIVSELLKLFEKYEEFAMYKKLRYVLFPDGDRDADLTSEQKSALENAAKRLSNVEFMLLKGGDLDFLVELENDLTRVGPQYLLSLYKALKDDKADQII